MSGDPEQEYFSDGISEDLITALSRVRQFRVVARNSTFSYKGMAPDIRKVAKELGARYVIEGSVRKAGSRVRISCQLIDGSSGNHIWAKRFDRELQDIFAVQDELTETIAAAIRPELNKAEMERAKAKRPESLDAWDMLLRGISEFNKGRQENLAEASRWFRQALEIDRDFAAAYAWIAETHYFEALGGYVADVKEHRREATVAARRAIELDSEDPLSRVALARSRVRGDPQTAIEECRRAIELDSAHVDAYNTLGRALIWAGRAVEAVQAIEVAIRLSPRDIKIGRFMARMAEAQLCLGNFEEAIEWGRKSVREPGIQYFAYTFPISAMGHLDRLVDAEELIGELLAWKPETTCEFARGQYSSHAYQNLYVDGLRKAGVPE